MNESQKQIEDLKKQVEKLKSELEKHTFKSKTNKSGKFVRKSAEIWAGSNLKNSVYKFYQELPKIQKDTFAELTVSLIKRFTRIGLFAVAAFLIPILFLAYQTYLLKQQNYKIDIQNQKIEKQLYLEEAARRSNLILIMDNILSQMNVELNAPNNEDKKISKPLIGRLIALVQGLKPYKFLEDGELSKPLSPERGQLLIALINSEIDTTIIQNFFSETAFSFSDLSVSDLSDKYLWGIYLDNSRLIKSNFSYSNMKFANFTNSDLRYSDFRKTDLEDADFRFCDLRHSILRYANLNGVDFRNANLDSASVKEANWIDLLPNWDVIGYEEIKLIYELEGPYANIMGDPIYYIVRKDRKKGNNR